MENAVGPGLKVGSYLSDFGLETHCSNNTPTHTGFPYGECPSTKAGYCSEPPEGGRDDLKVSQGCENETDDDQSNAEFHSYRFATGIDIALKGHMTT